MAKVRRPTARVRAWPVAAVLASGLALAACGSEAPVPMPAPPAPLIKPARYAFGDAISALDHRAAGVAWDLLRPQYGRGRERSFVAPKGTDFAALTRWYDARAARHGWRPVPDFGARLGRERHGLAYAGGGRAFALTWIDRTAPDGSRPVTVARFDGD